MKTPPHRTAPRSGNLANYSFYYSNRTSPAAQSVEKPARGRKGWLLLVALLFIGGFWLLKPDSKAAAPVASTNKTAPAPAKTPKAAAVTTVNECASNTLEKQIIISVQQRHLWACAGSKVAYDTPVITGMEQHASTLTPLGTYKIYGKTADTVLTGSDETGTWRDPVSYWMPFLDNQYGTYGFHDATWRNASEFGKVDPNGDKASHGCVELPLGASKWLYEWSPVGTTLTVEA